MKKNENQITDCNWCGDENENERIICRCFVDRSFRQDMTLLIRFFFSAKKKKK